MTCLVFALCGVKRKHLILVIQIFITIVYKYVTSPLDSKYSVTYVRGCITMWHAATDQCLMIAIANSYPMEMSYIAIWRYRKILNDGSAPFVWKW